MDEETKNKLNELRCGVAELEFGLGILLETIDGMLASNNASKIDDLVKSVAEFGRGMARLVGVSKKAALEADVLEELRQLADEIADQRAALDELHTSIETVLESGDAAEAKKLTAHVRAHAQVLIDAARRISGE
jgi:hypothetical protein